MLWHDIDVSCSCLLDMSLKPDQRAWSAGSESVKEAMSSLHSQIVFNINNTDSIDDSVYHIIILTALMIVFTI